MAWWTLKLVPYWECETCGSRYYQPLIDLGNVVCECGIGKGFWFAVTRPEERMPMMMRACKMMLVVMTFSVAALAQNFHNMTSGTNTYTAEQKQEARLAPRVGLLTGSAYFSSTRGLYVITWPPPNECVSIPAVRATSRVDALYRAMSNGGFTLHRVEGVALTVWTIEEWEGFQKSSPEFVEHMKRHCKTTPKDISNLMEKIAPQAKQDTEKRDNPQFPPFFDIRNQQITTGQIRTGTSITTGNLNTAGVLVARPTEWTATFNADMTKLEVNDPKRVLSCFTGSVRDVTGAIGFTVTCMEKPHVQDGVDVIH